MINIKRIIIYLALLLNSMLFSGCCATKPAICSCDTVNTDSSKEIVFAHEELIDIMESHPGVLTFWNKIDADSPYYYPEEANCQEKNDLTVEFVEQLSKIESLRIAVFSWSNANDKILEPLFDAKGIQIIYLDGLDVSYELIDRFLSKPSVITMSIGDMKISDEQVRQLRVKYPEKEIID